LNLPSETIERTSFMTKPMKFAMASDFCLVADPQNMEEQLYQSSEKAT
jgi:hypothetical protein